MCLVIWFHMLIFNLAAQISSLCFPLPQVILLRGSWTLLFSMLMCSTLLVGGLLCFSDQPLTCVLPGESQKRYDPGGGISPSRAAHSEDPHKEG